MLLNELFHNTSYDYSLFSDDAKAELEGRIFTKSVRGADVPYIVCAIRKKEIKLTPEEAVRQLFVHKLLNEYIYPANQTNFSPAKFRDICIPKFGDMMQKEIKLLFDMPATTTLRSPCRGYYSSRSLKRNGKRGNKRP